MKKLVAIVLTLLIFGTLWPDISGYESHPRA